MAMSWIWFGMITASLIFSAATGRGSAVTAALAEGAQSAVTLSLSMAGALCLWTGVGRLMERCGLTTILANLIGPLLRRVFPSSRRDPALASILSGNICANLLGLGNAATPMGIQAVKRLADPSDPNTATDEMCRLVVLNTASIQLIPSTVAAIRSGLGCPAPFDILPAVWATSLTSAAAGLAAAWLLGRRRRHA
jgi:spore maturation protein A